ncbi:MAG: hypothetical protein HRF43_09540, partial [Phycisphaerae bacterium]
MNRFDPTAVPGGGSRLIAWFCPLLIGALSCNAAPADLDRDGDVDQTDFGLLQQCLTGPNVAQTDPACVDALLDDDADVDQDDLAGFQDCAGGSDVPADPACTPQGRPYFPRSSIWYQDVSRAPVDVESDQVIAWLQSAGGWGFGRMQIDFSIEVLEADASTPLRGFIRTGDFYSPDCDFEPVPVPPGGALEGESGYACESDGDCHLIVVDRTRMKLFEMWRANIVGESFYG